MSARYDCDVCGLPVDEKNGKVHAIENTDCDVGHLQGFAFFNWSEEAARDPEYGHVHTFCVGQMVDRYMETLKWGRIVTGRRSIHISERKLAARKKA